jgi:hypothetical protein
MYNPRWPHTFTAVVPTIDENGLPVLDENGDPVVEPISFEKVMYDSRMNPLVGADGAFQTEMVDVMQWGYRTSTGGIKDSGEVFRTDFKISCPMMLTHLEEGTILTLTDATHTFIGVVKKMTTYNWGTNIWIDRQGNDEAAEE